MSSKKIFSNRLKIKLAFWAIVLPTIVWSFFPNPRNPRIIIPWAIAAICFIGWKFSVGAHVSDKSKKRKVKRYK